MKKLCQNRKKRLKNRYKNKKYPNYYKKPNNQVYNRQIFRLPKKTINKLQYNNNLIN